MSHELRIAVSEKKGDTPVTILYVSGDLDSKTYGDLETKAGGRIAARTKNILLDLHEVHFRVVPGCAPCTPWPAN